jgi:hypothetical protein
MPHFDQTSAECFIFTFKEGLLAAVAHDLKIKVTRFSIDVDSDTRTVEARFEADSLRVVCAMQGGSESRGTLSAKQKQEIEGNIVGRDGLDAQKYPDIRFKSTAVQEIGDRFVIKGSLALHGKRKTIEANLYREGSRHVARAKIHQPDFAIQPYSAMFGTLKVKADVEVQVVVPSR